jgi:DNA mismatch repair ATPase MutS
MVAVSVLFPNPTEGQGLSEEPEPCLKDLNLGQVIDAITAGKQAYHLKPFFYNPLHDIEAICYRQEVMRDIDEDPTLTAHLKSFADQMVIVRRYLSLVENLEFPYHKRGWFLEAALVYSTAVRRLMQDLELSALRSRGLIAFRDFLRAYVHSETFRTLAEEAQEVKRRLSELKYCIIIQPGRFKVKMYEGEPDYSVDVEKTFEKFKQHAAKEYRFDPDRSSGMNHIEAQILEFVSRLYPEPFAALDRFCESHAGFVDETIRTFDREIQFYIAYLDFIVDMRRRGMPFCYPAVTLGREVYVRDGFDLALAHALRNTSNPVVCNDFFLQGPERIIVVTGPNQGGKTTFARMFGQLHYLAGLGLLVPAREARLALFDHIFTHFEREEDISNLRGKLEDDLIRIHDILQHATPESIVVLNEVFASTTVKDAILLSKAIMERLMELDLLCVWVTFLDELSSLNEKTVSMVSTVLEEDPTQRTFKIIRKPADGLAYAISLARKHGLTYEQIKERISA